MSVKSSTALFFIILSSVTLQTIGNFSFANEYLVVVLLLYFVAFKQHLGAPIIKTAIFFLASATYSYLIHSNLTIAILIDLTTILKPFLIGVLCAGLSTTLRARHKTILLYLFAAYMLYNWILLGLGLSEWHYGQNWEMAGSSALLFLFSLLFLNKNRRGMYILLLCLLSAGFIASGQGKHMAFFALAFAVILYFQKFYDFMQGKNVATKFLSILLIVVLAAATLISVIKLAEEDVSLYYMPREHTTARRAFLINLPKVLANGYILFGRGLASYGSQASGTYYSPLYYNLGMDKVYGLYRGNTMFVNDAYYAMYIGQLGIAGLLFQVFYWRYMLSPFWSCFRSKSRIPTYYLILSALAVAWSFIFMIGSGLFNSQGCFVMCALGIARSEIKALIDNTNTIK